MSDVGEHTVWIAYLSCYNHAKYFSTAFILPIFDAKSERAFLHKIRMFLKGKIDVTL